MHDLREKVKQFLETNGLENRFFGLEIDYRYRNPPVVVRQTAVVEPEWDQTHYKLSTWSRARVPSVRLSDGKRNAYNLLGQGPEFSNVDFTNGGRYADNFVAADNKLVVPLKVAHLLDEAHVRSVWERDAVLVRPDDHVAWRSGRVDVEIGVDAEALAVSKRVLGCRE